MNKPAVLFLAELDDADLAWHSFHKDVLRLQKDLKSSVGIRMWVSEADTGVKRTVVPLQKSHTSQQYITSVMVDEECGLAMWWEEDLTDFFLEHPVYLENVSQVYILTSDPICELEWLEEMLPNIPMTFIFSSDEVAQHYSYMVSEDIIPEKEISPLSLSEWEASFSKTFLHNALPKVESASLKGPRL